jgi:hypothetical protein
MKLFLLGGITVSLLSQLALMLWMLWWVALFLDTNAPIPGIFFWFALNMTGCVVFGVAYIVCEIVEDSR